MKSRIPGITYESRVFVRSTWNTDTQSIVYEKTGCRRLTILWNHRDAKMDESMEMEYTPSQTDRLNMMWVETMKTMCGWKHGEKIYAMLKSQADGYFDVWYSKNEAEIECCDLVVEPSGYAYRRFFKNESQEQRGLYIKTPSDYNDCVNWLNTKMFLQRMNANMERALVFETPKYK